MSIQRRTIQKQGLTDYETFIIENSPNDTYFNVFSVEETIPGGRSTFQLLGSEFLEPDVEIKIELLDVNGNTVYIEPIKYLNDDPSRHIMIEVYPDTPAGVGKLTILGSINRDTQGQMVPDEWKGLYNIKWEKKVNIDPIAKNTQPILFQGQAMDVSRNTFYPLPDIEVSEAIKGILIPSGSGGDTYVSQSTFVGGNYNAASSPIRGPVDITDMEGTSDQFTHPSLRGATDAFGNENRGGVGGGGRTSKPADTSPVDDDTPPWGDDPDAENLNNLYEEFHEAQSDTTPPIQTGGDIDDVTKGGDEYSVTGWKGNGTLIQRTSGEEFRLELEGGSFRAIPTASEFVSGIAGNSYVSSSYTASIVAVHSPDLIQVDRPFLVKNSETGEFYKIPHTAPSFEIDYEELAQTATSTTSSVVLRSFAQMTFKNLRTFSGDVHRVKVFAKGVSTQGNWELITDRPVDVTDVLRDPNSATLTQKIGRFVNQDNADSNWKLKRLIKGSRFTTLGEANNTGSMTFTSSASPPLMNAILISGSNSGVDESLVFETSTHDLKVRPEVDYNLSINAILKTGEKDILKSDGTTETQSRAKVRFYLSGSKLSQDLAGLPVASTGSIENYLGDPIKVIRGTDDGVGEVITLESDNPEIGKTIDFGKVQIPFKPNFTGSAVLVNDDTKLQIEVESGQLYIQSVELTPATDLNFNPDEFTVVSMMPKLSKRPDLFDFVVQFYDRNGSPSPITAGRNRIEFDGQNDVIQGTDNLLTGSLAIGNALNTGIEAAGVNSAYLRSVDYAGFDSSSVSGQGGFLIFSGSVSRSLNTSESYDGVGLELHDGNSGSFKFRTQNADGVGEFDVRTNKFFFGKEGVQFVSGSDDKIEISSSNFHLKGDGNLIIGAGADIKGGLTADSILVPEGSTTTNALASITSTGAARFTSASIGGFEVTDAHISSSGLLLKSSGQITASNVRFVGGTITEGVTVSGSFAANSVLLPSSGTPTAIITAQGEATFSKAQVADFKIDTQEIRALSGSLILSASGAITASDVLITGTLNATSGSVFRDLTNLHATSGALENDISSSISKSIEIELETSSSVTSQSLIRTSLTSSKTESDLVAKGFGENSVLSASLEVTSSLTSSLLFATSSLTSSLLFTSESLEFTREQTGSLKDFSLGAAESGSAASTQSRLDAVATASADVTTKVTSLNTTITGSFVPVKADMSSSIAEIVEVQVETSASKAGLASSITQLTSSISESKAIMVSSSAGIDFASSSAIIGAQNITNEGISPIKDDVTSSFSQLGSVSSSYGAGTASLNTTVTGSFGDVRTFTTRSFSLLDQVSSSYGAGTASLNADVVDVRTGITGSNTLTAQVSHSFGLATASIKTQATSSDNEITSSRATFSGSLALDEVTFVSGGAAGGRSAAISASSRRSLKDIFDMRPGANKLSLRNDLTISSEQATGNTTSFSSYIETCVLPGTKILIKREDILAQINIEDTKKDDLIYVFDFKTKEFDWSPIKKITNRMTKEGWSHIKTEKGYELKCSNSHLLYHPDYPNNAIATNELGIGGQLYVFENNKIVEDKINFIQVYDELVEVWNYELEFTHNYISNGILSHNAVPKPFTAGHRYFSSENLQKGDLVRLNQNNEIVKTTEQKDSSVLGIVWYEFCLDSFSVDGEAAEKSDENIFRRDSMGRIYSDEQLETKKLWKIASIGDTRFNYYTKPKQKLNGLKICNQNGEVKKGDLLCSSDTPGYAMKQPTEFVITSITYNGSENNYEERQNMNSFTIGKSMEDVEFDENGKSEGVYGYLYCG